MENDGVDESFRNCKNGHDDDKVDEYDELKTSINRNVRFAELSMYSITRYFINLLFILFLLKKVKPSLVPKQS